MADDGTDEKFKLDLDNSDWVKKLGDAKESITKLGDTTSLSGLTNAIKGTAGTVALLGGAALALKVTMDTIFEAEQIKQVNDQFDALTSTFGVATETLREGLEQSAGGLVKNIDLLKAANKGVEELGINAKKLPEIMELARKVTNVFGGDLITNFEGMNQAIATGNTRVLKHMGIIIDSSQAYKNYAKSIGSTVDQLTEAQKQAAIMDTVLTKGNATLKNVAMNNDNATNSWAQIKNIVSDIGEVFVTAFDRAIGPFVRNFLKGAKDMSGAVKEDMVATFGDGADQMIAKKNQLSTEFDSLSGVIARATEEQKKGNTAFGDYGVILEGAKKRQAEVRSELTLINEEMRKTGMIEHDLEKEAEKRAETDKEAIRLKTEHNIKFNETLGKLNDERVAAQMSANDIEYGNSLDLFGKTKNLLDERADNEELLAEKIRLIREKTTEDIRKINQEQHFSEAERAKMTEQLVMQSGAKVVALERQQGKTRADNTKSTIGIMAGLAKSGNSTMAAIGKAAGVAQIAIDTPKAIANAIASDLPYPLNFVAAGVVAAAMAEQAASLMGVDTGGGSGGGSAGAPSAPAISAGSATPTMGTSGMPALPDSQPQKTVSVNIYGTMLGTDETHRWLMENIRAASDATDFNINKIGQS